MNWYKKSQINDKSPNDKSPAELITPDEMFNLPYEIRKKHQMDASNRIIKMVENDKLPINPQKFTIEDAKKIWKYYSNKYTDLPMPYFYYIPISDTAPYGAIRIKKYPEKALEYYITDKTLQRPDFPLIVRHEIEHVLDKIRANYDFIPQKGYVNNRLVSPGHHFKHPKSFESSYPHIVAIKQALQQKKPVSAIAVDFYKIKLPEGYTKVNDQYIFGSNI